MRPPPRPAGTTDKAAWRGWARAVLADIDVAAVSAAVREHLRPRLADVAGRVLVYRAMPVEVDLWPLVSDIGADRFAVTRTPARGPLTVHGAEGPFEWHPYGFEQPLEQAPVVEAVDLGAALVPGAVFDRRGVRLGRGAGYYDRLLADVTGIPLVGVTPAALVVPVLPAERHDVPMTHLVTEQGLTAARSTRPTR